MRTRGRRTRVTRWLPVSLRLEGRFKERLSGYRRNNPLIAASTFRRFAGVLRLLIFTLGQSCVDRSLSTYCFSLNQKQKREIRGLK
jgi:hypothetical protein